MPHCAIFTLDAIYVQWTLKQASILMALLILNLVNMVEESGSLPPVISPPAFCQPGKPQPAKPWGWNAMAFPGQ